MSELVRFEIGPKRIKTRIYERSSVRQPCMLCRKKAYGLLLRQIEPEKKDEVICHECIVRAADQSAEARFRISELIDKGVQPPKTRKKTAKKSKKKPLSEK